MTLTSENIVNLMKNSDHEYFGLRADKPGLNAGDVLDNSHQWFQDYIWDGNPDEDEDHPYNAEIGCWDDGELNGTCAVYIDPDMTAAVIEKRLSEMRYYLYKNHSCIYLIAGDDMETGNDINEAIIENARVLALVSDQK